MASEFTELYVEGDHDIVRGFVGGFLGGAQMDATLLVNSDHGVADDGVVRQMAEKAHLVDNITHVLVEEKLHQRLVTALAQQGADLGLTLCGEFAVTGARLSFEWEVYSLEEAMKARRPFENELPAQIKLENYAPEEIIDAKAKSGMYSPVHSLTVKAAGEAVGRPDILITWAVKLHQNQFINVDTIRLEYTD